MRPPGGGDDAVELELRGWDLERVDGIAAEIRRRMEGVPGVTGVPSPRSGRPRRDAGRPTAEIDGHQLPPAFHSPIGRLLGQAEERRGAIGIGHPYPETLERGDGWLVFPRLRSHAGGG